MFVTVPAPSTTQECVFCGALNNVTLDMKEFESRGRHRILDRDINAAGIVLKRGIAKVGRDTPELKPAETRPLHAQTTGHASQVVEAGTTRGGYHAPRKGSRKPTAGSPRIYSWEDVTELTRLSAKGWLSCGRASTSTLIRRK